MSTTYCEVCAKPGAHLFPEPVDGRDVYACPVCTALIDKVIVDRQLALDAEETPEYEHAACDNA